MLISIAIRKVTFKHWSLRSEHKKTFHNVYIDLIRVCLCGNKFHSMDNHFWCFCAYAQITNVKTYCKCFELGVFCKEESTLLYFRKKRKEFRRRTNDITILSWNFLFIVLNTKDKSAEEQNPLCLCLQCCIRVSEKSHHFSDILMQQYTFIPVL